MPDSLSSSSRPAAEPKLKRTLGLAMVVLFGLGVTIGAGIYVLIGAAAGRAGPYAPVAFVLAALAMAPTAASIAEFATRLPRSAAAAVYVGAGFRSDRLARAVGLFTALIGIVSAAAIARGSAGYIRTFIDIPPGLVTALVVLATGALAAKGIKESVGVAGLMTLVEVAGLVLIVLLGIRHTGPLIAEAPALAANLADPVILSGIISASLLAFFAFIGFEGIANIAEEVHEPERTLPLAILITLVVATVLYILVTLTALAAVPRAELAAAEAPLSLVFRRITGASPALISAIAIIAITNGVIVQMIMASRIIYGLADQGLLPRRLASISPRTQTPLLATLLVVVTVTGLALLAPLERLAETTSFMTLAVFAAVNAALVMLKMREGDDERGTGFRVPLWVPASGCALSLLLMLAALLG